MTIPHLPKATGLAHHLIAERVSAGDSVVDATVGNGHDTLFLAKCVGESGSVTGFDIQSAAIAKAWEVLAGFPQVRLHQMDHSELAKIIAAPINAAMFNLGYLPSGDKSIITKSSSTIAALKSCSILLACRGIITIVLYTGHDGGVAESSAVRDWCADLKQSEFTVAQYRFLNQINNPPYLIVIERK